MAHDTWRTLAQAIHCAMNGIGRCAGATLFVCSALAGALAMGCGNDEAQATRVETSAGDGEFPAAADAVREPGAVQFDSDASESDDVERDTSGDAGGVESSGDDAAPNDR
jgi:hypothetical protein